MQKLLICDDESIIRKGLVSIIEKKYPKLTIAGIAANGFEAYQLILDYQPEIVLMDINMPGMSGLEVMEKTTKYSPQTIFIIISGYDEFQYAQKAIRLKVFDYLLKPIDREKLFETIDKALNLSMQEEIIEANADNPLDLSLGSDAVNCIYRNFKDPEFRLSSVSAQLHVSNSYLSRIIKKETKMSFSEFLTKVRMETALALLIAHPQVSTLKISEDSGFRNQHYFSKVFRQYTGYTPTEYREKYRR